jgi:glutamate synthase domain-containing protein 3
VVILGETGRNLGAGMTGGDLWVHDARGCIPKRLNAALVSAERPAATELEAVRELVAKHLRATDSGRAAELLAGWETEVSRWWHVAPKAAASVDRTQDGVVKEVAAARA